MNKVKTITIALGCLLCSTAFAQYPKKSTDGLYTLNLDANGCMVQGYDVVDLHSGKQVKGNKEFESVYHDGKYWFTSKENKTTFDANPEKYAPLYGGFCAVAVTEGNLRPVQIWTHRVVNDRLVLNHNKHALQLWKRHEHKNFKKAQKNWPTVNGKPAAFDLKKGESLEDVIKSSYGEEPK